MLNKTIAKAHVTAQRFRESRPNVALASRVVALAGGQGFAVERFKTEKDGKAGGWAADPQSFASERGRSVGSLYVYDIIGSSFWTGEGVTAQAVAAALAGMDGVTKLNVYINSEGGDVFEAKAIYSQLKRFSAEKVVYVDGIAASAATFVAMAGDRIVTAPEATWMVHEAWGGAMGEANDLRAYADVLDMQNEDLANIYSKRTGGTVEEMRQVMADETWMNAEDALEMGFTDEIAAESVDEESVAAAASASKSKMVAASRDTLARLSITAADRMAFVAAARATQAQRNSTRSNPAKVA